MNDPRPVVICSATGQPIDVKPQDQKGFDKTVETGHLWCRHPETDRLLPYDDAVPAGIRDMGTWFLATLAAPGVGEEKTDRRKLSEDESAAAGPAAGAGDPAIGADSGIGMVLDQLAAVVQQRRGEMPEGSYTTHLFTAGASKIRKKTGEEAIELVLAQSRSELISEAADLLYHLLVLLETEDIALAEIAAALKQR